MYINSIIYRFNDGHLQIKRPFKVVKETKDSYVTGAMSYLKEEINKVIVKQSGKYVYLKLSMIDTDEKTLRNVLSQWFIEKSIDVKNKIYKTVEQECSGCGKHFYIEYCSDGNYKYIGGACGCLATFHPVDGEPSFEEWLELIK